MALTWRKALSVPTLYSGCGLLGVFCLGSHSAVALIDDLGGPLPTQNAVRIVRSTDDGVTWTEGTPLVSSEWFALGTRARAIAANTLLLGNQGPVNLTPIWEAGAVVARSTDGGVSWASTVDSATFALAFTDSADYWQCFDFLTITPTHILALGAFQATGAGARSIYWESTDSGATFGPAAHPKAMSFATARCGISLGLGVLLIGLDSPEGGGNALRSTDGGVSWAPLVIGTGAESITSIVNLGGGIAVAAGNEGVFRTGDYGANWAASTVLPGVVIHELVAVTTSLIVGGQVGANAAAGDIPFLYSDDGGASFLANGTIVDSFQVGHTYTATPFMVADNGIVLAPMVTGTTGDQEVWAGTFDEFSGPGPCVTNPVVTEPPTTTGGCVSVNRNRQGECIDTLTDDDIIRGRWQAGDRLIINRVIFSIDWDYLAQQFTKHVIYTFDDSVAKYGLRPAMRIESKGIRSAPTPCGAAGTIGCGISQLDERAFNIGARYADPPPMLNLEIFYRKHTWEPGDIICVTSAFVPNVVSGRRGIVDEAFEIINIQQNFAPEGKIILSLLDVEAITLPGDPTRIDAEEEQELLQRERPRNVEAVQVPRRVAEGRHLRHEVARWQRGPQQEPPPIIPRPAPRREVLAGSGGRSIAPTVP